MNPPELEKPSVIEIQVRIDCNGCVNKIKKALYGINGIYDIYIDFPQQKLTIIGWADPEKIVKAIRKSRKTATLCSHTQPPPDQQAQPPPEGGQPPPEGGGPPPEGGGPPPEGGGPPPQGGGPPPPPESANPPPQEAPPGPPAEPPPPPPENPPPEAAPPPPATDAQPGQCSGPKDVGEVHVIYHHPPDYGYRYSYGPSSYPSGPGISYNTYKPSPYVTQYVTPPQYSHHNRQEPLQYSHHYRPEPPQYSHHNRPEPPQYVHHSKPEPPKYMHYSRPDPPQYSYYSRPDPQPYTYYGRPEQFNEDYRSGNSGNGNISSIFSDENPNACRIV